jgi:putative ABC transport system ATP-binding protein
VDKEVKLAVHVRHVSKQFGQGNDIVKALRDVNFDARVGEILMIVGPSGCGKTTLLSVIAGTLRFDTGEVDVFDVPLHELSESQITRFRRQNVGFIFQQYHLIRTLNCLENVSIPLLLNGFSKAEAEERAALALEKVGLKGKEKENPRKLSGGQQQRVAISRALIHEPRLVICDEPTAALDAETGSKIMELMAEVARAPGRCVIVVTHDSRIFKYADRIAKMNDGEVLDIASNHHSH